MNINIKIKERKRRENLYDRAKWHGPTMPGWHGHATFLAQWFGPPSSLSYLPPLFSSIFFLCVVLAPFELISDKK